MNKPDSAPGKGRLIAHIILKYLGRLLILILTAAIGLSAILFSMLKLACNDRNPAVRELFASTILETGALKWTAKLVMTEDEINSVLAGNAMAEMDAEIDSSLITIAAHQTYDTESGENDEPFDINGITIEHISGRTFEATMLIVNDPSRIFLETMAPDWKPADLQDLVEKSDSLGGINGGIYDQLHYVPQALAVSRGEVVWNEGAYQGLYIVGFDYDNILRIIDAKAAGHYVLPDLVKENNIRDAIVFPDFNNPDMTHFVKLVINGEPREISGTGSGCNPRTAIGQRADGSVLLLVTDGRGCNGHLGATAQDLIDIMMDYGAVNAANIDGGSSSAMYFDGEYLMTSTTLYLTNTSYKLPTGFMIERRGDSNE